jgi:ferrous-iron efflux pump FieF
MADVMNTFERSHKDEALQASKRQVMWLAVSVAAFLMVLKAVSAFLTHSMGILASAADSLLDLFVSGLNLFAVLKASKPPDKGHPYGHGKLEHIAGLFQCFFMGLSVFYLVSESLHRLGEGPYLKEYGVGFTVMVLAMLISLALVVRLNHLAKTTRSVILETEGLHYASDILTNGGVILALFLCRVTGLVVWDVVISLVIAVYLAVYIFNIAKKAINELMDHELPPERQRAIKDHVLRYDPRIIDIHDFRSRSVGEQAFAEFHITIRGEKDFKRAHNLTESLVASLRTEFPELEVNIHYDPEGAAEPHRPELPD